MFPLALTPDELRKMLKQPGAILVAPITRVSWATLREFLEKFELVYREGMLSMLKEPEFARVFEEMDEEGFPSQHFVGSGPLIDWLEDLLADLRKVEFDGELKSIGEVKLRVRVIKSPKCAFCGVLPWGTVLIGMGLLTNLKDVNHLIAILLHEVEHFETWDFSLVLNYLPLLFSTLNQSYESAEVANFVRVLQDYISYRSQYLEQTADKGSLDGLAYFGLPTEALREALADMERIFKMCPLSLADVLTEVGLLSEDLSTSSLSEIQTHPEMSYRLGYLGDIAASMPSGVPIAMGTLPERFSLTEMQRLLQR